MFRNLICALGCAAAAWVSTARADVVLDWNATLRGVIQTDGILNTPALANPGWPTRTMAMANGAIYDAFQAVNRTHSPFLSNRNGAGASAEAAAAQAAYDVILECYPLEQTMLTNALNASLAQVADVNARNNGVALGHLIAQDYAAARLGDGADVSNNVPYTPGVGPGLWRPRPGQSAWGPGYGAVPTFSVKDSNGQHNAHDLINALPPPPALGSQAYTDAFNQVENYRAQSVYGPANTPTSRTAEQAKIGLFWAYDRPSMGPPPVIFLNSIEEISKAAGVDSNPQENARLFAMASVAMADAAIASWDAKYQYNFWRPIAAVQEADTDGNANTVQDADWQPLGAPGNDPNSSSDDFTPPFPSWTSGHATMGGATYKALELFFGTNDFQTADSHFGTDPVTSTYDLTSQEAGSGTTRTFHSFTQTGVLDVGTENSPEGENGTSRIYLGIHWIFDQRDGIALGDNVASYVSAHSFGAVPEPGHNGKRSVLSAVVQYPTRADTPQLRSAAQAR